MAFRTEAVRYYLRTCERRLYSSRGITHWLTRNKEAKTHGHRAAGAFGGTGEFETTYILLPHEETLEQ